MRRTVKRGVGRFATLTALMLLGVWPAAGEEPDVDAGVAAGVAVGVDAGVAAAADTAGVVDESTVEAGDEAAADEAGGATAAGGETDLEDADESETSSRSWTEGWVPAFALTGSFNGHNYKSSLASECLQGGPASGDGALTTCSQAGPLDRLGPPTVYPNDPPTPLRDPASGSDFALWPGVGIDLHLMSPTIVELPLKIRPRLFINGEVTAQFPPERRIANEASLSDELDLPAQEDFATFPSAAIQGGGGETVSQPKTWQFGAQVGFVFPIEVMNRKVRIKPSFGWIHYQLDVSGRLLSPLKDDVNGNFGSTSNAWGPNLRTIELENSTTRTVNAIGPGLEIELESGRFGAIGAAMFVGVNAYKVLGDRTISLADEVEFPNGIGGGDELHEDTYSARWHHEIDPWMYRFRVGIRFHYLGKD